MTATIGRPGRGHDRPPPSAPRPSPTSSDPITHRRLRFWPQVVLVLAFYGVYTFVRNRFGSAAVPAERAFANAELVIHLEQHLGIFNEAALQQLLDWHPLMVFVNTWYGSLHFVVTIATLVALFRWFPHSYRRARNILAATTALALVGFSLFPLMPPRLLCDCRFGSGPAGAGYGFADTLARDGGFWNFGSSTMQAVSNQYAAMPSLHAAWAVWCVAALWPALARLRPSFRRWARGALAGYASFTVFVVVVTGNHFWLDVVGGLAVLAAGWVVGSKITSTIERLRPAAGREDTSRVFTTAGADTVP